MTRFFCACCFLLYSAHAVFSAETEYALTLYTQGPSVVQEQTIVELEPGTYSIELSHFPRTIIPESLHSTGQGLVPKSQVFRPSAVTPQQLLEAYVGQEIELAVWTPEHERTQWIDATLLSAGEPPVYLIDDQVHLGHPGRPVLPRLPEGWPVNDEITWLVDVETAFPQLQVSYLAQGLSWRAQYQLHVAADEQTGILESQALLSNQTNVDMAGAAIRLIAADINRVHAKEYAHGGMADMVAVRSFSADVPEPEILGDYYELYLPYLVDLKRSSVTRVPLTERLQLPLRKQLKLRGHGVGYGAQRGVQKSSAELHYLFDAPSALAQGKLRAFLQVQRGAPVILGETHVANSSKEDEVDLHLGNAFDIKGERRQTGFQQLTSNTQFSQWEWTVINRRMEDVEVIVEETFAGELKQFDSNTPYERVNATTVRWTVNVTQEPTMITYSAETAY